jgi:PAS domain S-box-containing protein
MRLRSGGESTDQSGQLEFHSGRLGRILILSLTCGCLAMIAAVWWYYTVEKAETEAATLRGTFAVAAGQTAQVANWRRERLGDGHVLMSSAIMRTARRALSSPTIAEADRQDLLDLMRRLAEVFLYADATLVDLDGFVRLRLHEEQTGGAEFKQRSRRELTRQANQANDVLLSDLNSQTRDAKPMISLTVPVQNLGGLILDIDPSRFLYPYLESWPGSSLTAESLLVRREGDELVYLNRSRQTPALAPFTRKPLTLSLPPDQVLDAGWSLETNDYRGVPVIGTIRRVPGTDWFLVCKMNVAEVTAPLHRLGWEMALITLLIGLANAAGAVSIWRGQQARMHREREAWFQSVANDTPAYLWMTSAAGETSFINLPFRKFLGTDRESLSSWTTYLHPDDVDHMQILFREAVAQTRGYNAEFRIRRFDGEYRTVASEAVPRFSAPSRFLGLAGSVIDITGRRRAEEQLRTANDHLQTELAERIRNEREIQTLSARLLGAREDERKRLARELHDDLNQQVAAVSLAIGNLKRNIPAEQLEARAQADRIHQKLVQIAETVRRMSHELHPAILEYHGLAAAMRSCCTEFGTLTGIKVSLTTDGSFENVPAPTALCVYRVTQEALQNVAKHARTSSATVELSHASGILRLTVSDSGAGMEPAKVDARTGLGLVSIRERVRFAGGTVEISSELNLGTRLTVRIPLENITAG